MQNKIKTSKNWVNDLQLEPHPEGGYYRRIYESEYKTPTPSGDRPSATSIHYLLERHDFSAWHKIKHDEIWFFHDGGQLLIRSLNPQGEIIEHLLGDDQLSVTIPGNTWFCSELAEKSPQDFALVSCVVTPGFDFADFEMGNSKALITQYPQHAALFERLCRE